MFCIVLFDDFHNLVKLESVDTFICTQVNTTLSALSI